MKDTSRISAPGVVQNCFTILIQDFTSTLKKKNKQQKYYMNFPLTLQLSSASL